MAFKKTALQSQLSRMPNTSRCWCSLFWWKTAVFVCLFVSCTPGSKIRQFLHSKDFPGVAIRAAPGCVGPASRGETPRRRPPESKMVGVFFYCKNELFFSWFESHVCFLFAGGFLKEAFFCFRGEGREVALLCFFVESRVRRSLYCR